ncbi:MAG: CDP-diacylglycerol--glycerol-3-phosphate 3-phosphatidyltransferase [Planctomycetota bacterium]|jgi:CDP-diacylglycerol--glycerol-3-phosphate 3-phosphatidyltransferase
MSGVFEHWPNRITAIRFVGSFVLFVLFALHENGLSEQGWYFPVCFWLFIVTALTDFLDGYLARRDNHISAFGRIADPFVDKVLVLGSMIFMAVMPWSQPWFPAWIVVTVLAREFLVTGIRGYVESLGKEFPADWFGKIKMVVQCVAIAAVISLDGLPWSDVMRDNIALVGHIFVWATLFTSVGSGLSYVLKMRGILSDETA